MNTKNYTSFLCNLAILFTLSSCNALKVLTGAETKIAFDENGTPPNIPYDNSHTLGFYRMEESFGTTAVSLSTTDLTIDEGAGNITSSGVVGNGFNCSGFTGAASKLYNFAFGPSLNNGEDFSLAFWVDITSTASETIIDFSTSGGTQLKIVSDDSDSDTVYDDLKIMHGPEFFFVDNVGGWSHVALISKSGGSSIEVWLNGTHINTSNLTPKVIELMELYVCNDRGAGNQFSGSIDSLGIWDRALSVEEVKGLYNGNNDYDL